METRNREASIDRSLLRGLLYAILAFLFTVLTLSSAADIWLFVVFFLPAFYFAQLSIRHFKTRHAGGFTPADLANKSPVLYLRPFDTDAGWDGAAPFSVYTPNTWHRFPLSPANLLAIYLTLTGRVSFEQALAWVTRKFGVLVAIGEPGQPPILGAKNLYVGDANWQEQIQELARMSQLVILTAGTSEGVLWEVSTMLQQLPPARFLLSVPGQTRGMRKTNYAAFYAVARNLFPASIPETLKGARFLLFDENWQPVESTRKDRRAKQDSAAWVAYKLKKLLA